MLDALIDETTADAHGDEETRWAFRQAFENHIVVPRDAFVAGDRFQWFRSIAMGTRVPQKARRFAPIKQSTRPLRRNAA
jgi:hypothetical protein